MSVSSAFGSSEGIMITGESSIYGDIGTGIGEGSDGESTTSDGAVHKAG